MDKVWVGQECWRYGCGSLYIFITILFFINEDLRMSLFCRPGPVFITGPGNLITLSCFCQVKMYGVHVESENENQNPRCWQDILTSDLLHFHKLLPISNFLDKYSKLQNLYIF